MLRHKQGKSPISIALSSTYNKDVDIPLLEYGVYQVTDKGARVGNGAPGALERRSFLRGALAGVAGVVTGALMGGCSDISRIRVNDESKQPLAQPTSTGSKVLLAYFSRAGENYFYGGRTNLTVGNTEDVGCASLSIPWPNRSLANLHNEGPRQHFPVKPILPSPHILYLSIYHSSYVRDRLKIVLRRASHNKQF